MIMENYGNDGNDSKTFLPSLGVVEKHFEIPGALVVIHTRHTSFLMFLLSVSSQPAEDSREIKGEKSSVFSQIYENEVQIQEIK